MLTYDEYESNKIIKRLTEENESLKRQRAELKNQNKKLKDALIKINGITMRELHDDQLRIS